MRGLMWILLWIWQRKKARKLVNAGILLRRCFQAPNKMFMTSLNVLKPAKRGVVGFGWCLPELDAEFNDARSSEEDEGRISKTGECIRSLTADEDVYRGPGREQEAAAD
jgi:hypothetical protein